MQRTLEWIEPSLDPAGARARLGERQKFAATRAIDRADQGPVIPVIVIGDVDDAVPLSQALLESGVRVLEVTLRTPAALRAMEAIARSVPEAIVGAGTLRRGADVAAVLSAGCRFAVSPGWSPAIAAACAERGLALLPGVATASEVLQANEARYPEALPGCTGWRRGS